MKKIWFFLVIILFCLPATTYAQQVKVNINGELVEFDDKTGYPFIDDNGCAQVPFRAVMEFFGAKVGWNQNTKSTTVRKNNMLVEFSLEQNFIIKNGEKVEKKIKTTVKNEKLFMPIRDALEPFGATLEYDKESNCILVNTFEDRVKIHYIDLGDSDAIMIEYGKFHALIDSGDSAHEEKLIEYLKKHQVDDIELFVLTNSKDKRIGGADAVFNNFDIQYIVDCDWLSNTDTFKEYISTGINGKKGEAAIYKTNEEDLVLTVNKDGSQPEIVQDEKITIKILGNKENNDINNASTVVYLSVFDTKLLFTSDLKVDGEKKFLQKVKGAQLITVGNNGDKISTSKELLETIKPKYAVISCGLKLPSEEVLKKLQQRNIKVLRTDKQGDIVCMVDGYRLKFFDKNTIPKNNDTIKYDVIIDVNDKEDIVRITNKSQSDIDMTGWKLISIKDNQVYHFQKGYILKANSSIIVASGSSMGDIQWSANEMWDDTQSDEAQLYDRDGNKVASDD
ncbi:lamin tail domain-containing protein [Clostridiaceae bacterium M8S5]|nr:lamin tail domain-containing protein [Clostridiaceae bacterium M8S5]